MPFPGSQAFRDEMVARSEEDARNARRRQSVEERLIVRDDDGVVRRGEIEKRIVRGSAALDDPVVLRQPLRGPRVPVVVRQQGELGEDRRRDRHLDIPEDATEFRIEMDLELERHEQGVRVEEDESRHRFRASVPNYLALRWESNGFL